MGLEAMAVDLMQLIENERKVHTPCLKRLGEIECGTCWISCKGAIRRVHIIYVYILLTDF